MISCIWIFLLNISIIKQSKYKYSCISQSHRTVEVGRGLQRSLSDVDSSWMLRSLLITSFWHKSLKALLLIWNWENIYHNNLLHISSYNQFLNASILGLHYKGYFKYQRFTVIISKQTKSCLFSACNSFSFACMTCSHKSIKRRQSFPFLKKYFLFSSNGGNSLTLMALECNH